MLGTETFYIDIDGGFTDTSLASVRLRAIEWLKSSAEKNPVHVYTSSNMNIHIGTVVYDPSPFHQFWWLSKNKNSSRRRPIYSNGEIKHPRTN